VQSEIKQKALAKANSRLRNARKALDDLTRAKTFIQFSDDWHVFLVAAKGIWTTLEQGTKETAQYRQWFGGKERQRRNDPLLQYLYEARNDDEHGIEPVIEQTPQRLAIGVAMPGFSSAMVINGSIGIGGALHVQTLDGKPALIEVQPSRPKLRRINARGNRMYDPPEVHLGTKLASQESIEIARLGIVYLEGLIKEFEQLS
jgi:hypothetical protein